MGSTKKDEVFTKVEGPIIVGGGPSGIAVAACLKQHGIPSLVLERNDCIASLWQQKAYDCVKLHLPKQVSAFQLACFELECGVWRVKTQDSGYEPRWLVVATGENAEALVPEIPGTETFEGPLVHASEYKNGHEFRKKKVVVIGCGNSGMEISLDLSNHDEIPFIVVRNSVHIVPREMFGLSTFGVATTLLKWLPIKLVDKLILSITNYILGDTEKLGLRRPKTGPMELKMTTGRSPVVDVGALSKIKTGNIKVVEQGVREITKNGVMFMDGQELECDCIVLATGYKSNVTSWLKGSNFFTDDGMPKTSFPNNWKSENGLYTVGFTRRGIFGAACDAVKVADVISNQCYGSTNDFRILFCFFMCK
ncbi:hypothetical protein L1987_10028 [Smallanthus sonchifolius]|uniref:Uncharacterized protein n=1 Tax=Smallanthus sonchifolius TaxID=185202 RepID=A0ACB9JRA5_9ASTR|nr:hypothetical protein L1987_10028 [Smallanthus sonchifolius]